MIGKINLGKINLLSKYEQNGKIVGYEVFVREDKNKQPYISRWTPEVLNFNKRFYETDFVKNTRGDFVLKEGKLRTHKLDSFGRIIRSHKEDDKLHKKEKNEEKADCDQER